MNISKDIKAVIFDLDGTLIDSMWLWKQIDIDYLGKHNLEFPHDLQSAIEGMSFTETALYFKETFQLPYTIEEIKREWNEMAWYKYTHEVPLKDGVGLFLDYLKMKNIKMGIATSNSRELVDLVVEKLGIKGYFHSIRTSCEVTKGKPSPDIYLLVANDLDVKAEECLVFEDVIHGIMAGINAGMKVCAVYDDFSKDVTDEKVRLADYFINSFNEIVMD